MEGILEYTPTLEEASVRLFRVVLLPADGFPTRPMRGSRPIAWQVAKAQERRIYGDVIVSEYLDEDKINSTATSLVHYADVIIQATHVAERKPKWDGKSRRERVHTMYLRAFTNQNVIFPFKSLAMQVISVKSCFRGHVCGGSSICGSTRLKSQGRGRMHDVFGACLGYWEG